MSALDLKLRRDLAAMWPQALAIALVLAAGVATLILAQGTYRSLFETREAYYERYRFADVFAGAKRAPNALIEQIGQIRGLGAVEGRVVGSAILDMPDSTEPVTAQLVSLPDTDGPHLNDLFLRRGQLPARTDRNKVVMSNAFAKGHKLEIGATIRAVMGGHERHLQVAGIADSPEFIYTIGPGELTPDDRRSAVIWMPRRALAAAFDLDGAFNSVTAKLLRGGSESEVLDQLDILLKPYGGRGAFGRKHQISHAFIDAELTQLRAMAVVMPPIFLCVAAFLIYMTLSRIIALERVQIGLFKALGYTNSTIATHYLKFALIIALTGFAIGCLGGWWLGRALTLLYGDFFKFPFLFFTKSPQPYIISWLVSLTAGGLGAAVSVFKVVQLAPAVAMQPPSPPRYRRLSGDLGQYLPKISQLSMTIVRQLIRWPFRAAFTVLGISLSIAILVGSLFVFDSVEDLIDVTFFQINRQDATITFTDPRPLSVLESVAHLPGVLVVEPERAVPVRIRNANIERRTVLIGMPGGNDLVRVLDGDRAVIRADDDGIILSTALADLLKISAGDSVQVELLEGRGHSFDVTVIGLNTSYIGIGALMSFEGLNDRILDPPLVSAVNLSFDVAEQEAFFAAVKSAPSLAGLGLQKKALANFRDTLAENITLMTTIYLLLAGLVAFGVVYNTARIRLSERGRELASLRVLGFTKAEIFWVLFGELLILVLASIPLGWFLGYGLAYSMVQGLKSELYQMPLVILPGTYATAALVVFAAGAVSAIVIRRRTNNLDLIAVLKTSE